MAYSSDSNRLRLTRKALILGKIESTYGTDPTPSASTDAALVSDPSYTVDLNVLERNFVNETLSPLGTRIGRKIASMTFGMEFRSNGSTNSGSTGDACMVGRFLRACGFSETGVTGNATVGTVTADAGNTTDPSGWAVGGTNTSTGVSKYRITCVLGGASATAELRVTGGQDVRDTTVLNRHDVTASVFRFDGTAPTVTLAVDESDPLAVDVTVGGSFQAGDICQINVCGARYEHTVVSGDTDLTGIAVALAALIDVHSLIAATNTSAVVNITYTGAGDGTAITSGTTAITLGESGMTVTPTWTGSLTLGDFWEVTVTPEGIQYDPVSSGFESMTIYGYWDGVLHKLTGAFGTFSIEATAGDYATINFTFTGFWNDPVDRTVPSATHETQLPAIVELARLRIGDFSPIVNAFSFDMNNEITPRPDVNSDDGYLGVRVTGRSPTGGIDPEATYAADYDIWDVLSNSTEFEFSFRVGSTAGNRIFFNAPKAQYNGMSYGDRDGLLTYDAGLNFARDAGNDEVSFFFS